jgi:phage-related protein
MPDGKVEISTELDDKKLTQGLGAITGKVGAVAKNVTKIGAAAVGALAGASLKAYAEYEQLSGGIEKLFGSSAEKVQKYADNAYKSVQMSKNEYMDLSTQFASSMIKSLNGDTNKAAEQTNKAITQMRDNASVFGSNMEDIENAYKGFAKQNYTMLDNLKLGYGGTKTEMQRLLDDAEKISGIHYDISNMSDIVDAIQVIQTQMHVTGNAAKEASETIEGTANRVKSAWSNLITDLGNENADLSADMQNLLDSVIAFGQNAVPRLAMILEGLGKAIATVMQKLPSALMQGFNTITPLVAKVVDDIMTSFTTQLLPKMSSLMNKLPSTLQTMSKTMDSALNTLRISVLSKIPAIYTQLATMVGNGINMLMQATTTLLPRLTQFAIDLVTALGNSIITQAPTLMAQMGTFMQIAIQGIMQNLPIIAQQLLNGAQSLIQNLIAQLPALGNQLGSAIAGVIQTVATNLPTMLNQFTSVVGSFLGWLVTQIPSLVAGLLQFAWNVIVQVAQSLPTLLAQLPAILMSIFNVVVSQIGTLFPVIFNAIRSNLIPFMVSFFQGLGQTILQFIMQLPSTLMSAVGSLLSLGRSLCSAIGNGFRSILPQLPGIALQVGTFILSALASLPMRLLSAGASAMRGFVAGLRNIIPQIPSIGINAISSLANAVRSGIGRVGSAARNVASNCINTLRSALSPNTLVSVGSNLIKGLWNGISNVAGWIKSKIGGFCSGVVKDIKGFFQIHSPSRLMRDEVGKYLGLGIGVGFDQSQPEVSKMMTRSMKYTTDNLRRASLQDSNMALLGGIASNTNTGTNINQVVNVNQKVSTVGELAREMRLQLRYA